MERSDFWWGRNDRIPAAEPRPTSSFEKGPHCTVYDIFELPARGQPRCQRHTDTTVHTFILPLVGTLSCPNEVTLCPNGITLHLWEV